MKERSLRYAIVLMLLLVASGCSEKKDKYDATGTFETTEIVISAEVSGKITGLNVSEGDAVCVGEVVATIDSTQLSLQRLQLENSITALESSRPDVEVQLAPLQEQLSHQLLEKERIKKLLEADAVNTSRLEDIDSGIATLRKQIDAQRTSLLNTQQSLDAQIAALKAQLAQVEKQLSDCRVSAPASGTVVAKYVSAGELAAAGRPMMKIADLDNICLRAYLLSTQLPEISIGTQLTVYADFGGGQRREYSGTVTWISDRSEFTPKNIVTADDRANMVYAVKIAVQNDGFIKTGMYGGVILRPHE